jgi:hypothetical protein
MLGGDEATEQQCNQICIYMNVHQVKGDQFSHTSTSGRRLMIMNMNNNVFEVTLRNIDFFAYSLVQLLSELA